MVSIDDSLDLRDLQAPPQDPSFVEAHPTFRDGISKLPWQPIAFVTTACLLSSLAVTMEVVENDMECLQASNPPDPDNPDNGDKVLMLLVANLLIFFVALVLNGAPPELTLFFAGAVAVLAGGLEANVLYQGNASGAVVTLALLFPIMKAMGDTGVPDKFIGKFMGNPKTLRPALMRMFVAVALLSGLFNNTPIVVMMIPLLLTFCQRLNLDHRAMLMPLSYASQAGGSLTLMGTSINFVAQEVFGKGGAPDGFHIGFFTLTTGGCVIAGLVGIYCVVAGPILLGKSNEETAPAPIADVKAFKSLAEVQADLGKKNLFNVAILVDDQSPLSGSAVQDCGIHRIKGIHILHRILRASHGQRPRASTAMDASGLPRASLGGDAPGRRTSAATDGPTRRTSTASDAPMTEMSQLALPTQTTSAIMLQESVQNWAPNAMTRKRSLRPNAAPVHLEQEDISAEISAGTGVEYTVVAESWANVKSFVIQDGDVLQIAATADGVATLRNVNGLELGNDATELSYLGGRRRERILCEAAVTGDSIGQKIDIRAYKSSLRAGVVGIRSMEQPTLCRMSYDDYTIQPGDVLLLETFRTMVGSDKWLDSFGVVRAVPNSAPPRQGRKADLLRSIFIGLGLLTVVSLATLGDDRLTMPVMCTVFLMSLFVVKGLTVEEAYAEINARVLFTIVGALGLGHAMEKTRLANCIAAGIVSVAQPFGTTAIRVGLYVATVGIGQFLNSAANVAIMGSIGIPIAERMHIPLGQIAMVVTYAASACYMAPYGYQTNTLVIKDGGYSWGDFIKFGGMLQLFHLLLVVGISPTLCSLLPGCDDVSSGNITTTAVPVGPTSGPSHFGIASMSFLNHWFV